MPSVFHKTIFYIAYRLSRAFHLKEYKLIWFMASNDLKREYRRTLLGPAWILLNLIIFSLAVGLVYSELFSQNFFDYIGYMASGLAGWIWISTILLGSASIYNSNMNFMINSFVPKELFVWTFCLRQVFVFLHQLPFFLVLVATQVINNDISWFSLFFNIIILIIYSLSFSLVLSVIGARFADFQKLLQNLLIVVMVTTPIFWKPDFIGGVRSWMYEINPFYYLVELIRSPLLGNPTSFQYGAILLLSSLMSFWLAKKFSLRYSKYITIWL